MADYLGDIKLTSGAVYFSFLTVDAAGVPTTLSGSPAIGVRKNGTVLTLDTPPSLSVDAGSITGSNTVTVTFSADADYTAGADYEAYISAGTVDGVSVVGAPVARWSIENRQVNLMKDGVIGTDTFASGVLSTDVELAGAVWDEPRASHTDADSFGEGVNVYAMSSNSLGEIVSSTGITLTATAAAHTTTSVAVDDATNLSATQLDDALVLHLATGAYSRITGVAGSAPNLTLTLSPALPSAPTNDQVLVVYGKYLASL